MARGPSEVLDAALGAYAWFNAASQKQEELMPTLSEDDQQSLVNCAIVAGAAPTSELLWISEEMGDLLLAAATMPDHPLDLESLPWKQAFCLFERPVVGIPNTSPYWPEAKHIYCRAFSWITFPENHALVRKPCVVSAWFTQTTREYAPAVSTWWEQGELAEADGDRAEFVPLQKMMACLWSMVQQRIAVVTTMNASRGERRRFTAAIPDAPIDQIKVIRLRRPVNYAEPCDDDRVVNWSHRWIVNGHWRDQFHPSNGSHVPTWIAPYVKGPDDKPLVLKKEVNAWVR